MLRNLLLPYPYFRPDDPPPADPPADPSGDDPPPADDPPQDPPADPPGPVPYDRFKEVNEARKKAETELAKIRAEEKKRRELELAEQNKWQELAETRENELQEERLQRQRLEVAMRKGLPAELYDRLRGDSPDEMEQDADRLMQFLKPAGGPGTPPPPGRSRSSGPISLKDLKPEDVRKRSDELIEQLQKK